ncbi:MAG: FAD-dependent oxidoreductase [Elusimicrobiota bacterium]|nr:MAG: FAD-dependent oxidoreductase [Elusimicrobiota bacterium]
MVGAFSDRLGALKPHEEGGLVVRGPFGKWIYDGSVPHAVLVAGGTGVTPFRAMCLLKRDMGLAGRITVCSSAKTAADELYRDERPQWAKAGVSLHPRYTREGGARWTAGDVIAAAADPEATYFLCGPNKMVQELREGLEALGVPPEKVRTEKWGDYTDLF